MVLFLSATLPNDLYSKTSEQSYWEIVLPSLHHHKLLMCDELARKSNCSKIKDISHHTTNPPLINCYRFIETVPNKTVA